jgi:glycine cleavage system aminomethyltransferase T
MCNEHGGVIDDLYAYRLAAEVYLLIINASRIGRTWRGCRRRRRNFPVGS